jgi:MoxR-like ATPase
MKLSMGFPDRTEEVAILNRYLSEDASDRLSRDVEPVADAGVIAQVRALARKVRAGGTVLGYLADVIGATRNRGDIASGVSPRGSLAMLRTAQVMALFDDRDYIVPEDIRTLAVPVLAHRIILPHGYGSTSLSSDIIREILDSVPVPTETF